MILNYTQPRGMGNLLTRAAHTAAYNLQYSAEQRQQAEDFIRSLPAQVRFLQQAAQTLTQYDDSDGLAQQLTSDLGTMVTMLAEINRLARQGAVDAKNDGADINIQGNTVSMNGLGAGLGNPVALVAVAIVAIVVVGAAATLVAIYAGPPIMSAISDYLVRRQALSEGLANLDQSGQRAIAQQALAQAQGGGGGGFFSSAGTSTGLVLGVGAVAAVGLGLWWFTKGRK